MNNHSDKFTVQRLAILAILTALAMVGRILLQFIPNVQPVTAILIIITLTLGTADGIIVAIGSIFLSNLLLGMGPWTLAQILSFIIIILITGIFIRPIYLPHKNWKHLFISGFAFFTGILYGFIISIITVKMMGINNFWAYYLAGIPFDIMHGLGNLAFYFILEPIISPLIMRQTKKVTRPTPVK